MLIFLLSIPLLPSFAQYFNLPSMEPTTMSTERRETINENYTFIATDIYTLPPPPPHKMPALYKGQG